MVEKSELEKLEKKQLTDKVIELSNKLKKERWLIIGSSIFSIIVAIILITTYVTPLFCGIQVIYGGENLEIKPYNKQEGNWGISFKTTGFIPTKNIILHVEFLDDYAKVDYDSISFNVFPDVRKAEEDNKFEYRWDSYMGEIIVHTEVDTIIGDLSNYTKVTISTDGGIEYRYPAYI